MKNCLVCAKNISENEIVCKTCNQFLKWKHKGNFAERIANFKRFERDRYDFRSIKFRRKK